MGRVNHAAIVVNVMLQQVLGFLWYSPILFAQPWMLGIGKTPEDLAPGDPTPFVVAIFAAFLLSYGMNWLLQRLAIRNAGQGAWIGALVWAAFVGPTLAMHYAFLGLLPSVMMIDSGKELVGLLVTGGILAGWKRR